PRSARRTIRQSPPPPRCPRSRSFGSVESWCYLLALGNEILAQRWASKTRPTLQAFIDTATLGRTFYCSNAASRPGPEKKTGPLESQVLSPFLGRGEDFRRGRPDCIRYANERIRHTNPRRCLN